MNTTQKWVVFCYKFKHKHAGIRLGVIFSPNPVKAFKLFRIRPAWRLNCTTTGRHRL